MSPKLKLSLCILVLILISGTALLVANNRASQWLKSYVAKATEQELGSLPLNQEQEEKIKSIAQEVGITEPIIIRKMNQKAMAALGYHNAFAYFPLLFTFIPTNSDPYLFISEGFLEDLLPEEQRFLIGHEMIHIKERHTLYLNLFLYSLLLVLIVLSYLLTKKIQRIVRGMHHQKYIMGVITCVVGFICFSVPSLIGLAYRRHIEKVADCHSLQILKTYEGCAKLVDRWQKEFSLPSHNPYFGLLSDHPSCGERKSYCLALQNKKDIL